MGEDGELRERIQGWFSGRLPDDWFEGSPEITIDRDEIVVVGSIPAPAVAEGGGEAARGAAATSRAQRFREETRERRMRIADEAEHAFRRKVSWGVRVGDQRHLFTTVSLPVMTRLRQPERAVLDTLVEAGVARSRSDALVWCVRLVARNQGEWIEGLREALGNVQRMRSAGPSVD
jgi:hypothetical protein